MGAGDLDHQVVGEAMGWETGYDRMQFKCGHPGHWARDCPLAGGGHGESGGSFSSPPRFGGAGGHGDHLGECERFVADHYDRRHFGDREHFDSRDNKYGSRDCCASDRYPASGDRVASDPFGGSDHCPQNGYGKDRAYDRYGTARGNDRYGSGMAAWDEGRSYGGRPGPYDRQSRGGRPSSFDR